MLTNAELLPRRLAEGLDWLGDCLAVQYGEAVLHSYDSLYLVRGSEASLLVEAGFPLDDAVVTAQLDRALAQAAELRYIFATHQETPHAGGIGRLLHRYPEAVAVGDVRDYHLFFPELEHRFLALEVGDSLDLGGTTFHFVEPVVHDLPSTQWGFATAQRTLFTSDGFAFAHHHRADQCGRTTEELPDLDIAELGELFIDAALPWTRFVDLAPVIVRLEELIAALDVRVVAPSHGLPSTDVAAILPKVVAGLRRAELGRP